MPPPRARLDAELVKRRLARSREHAAQLIDDGRVEVRGLPATKAATAVDSATAIRVVTDDGPNYASRGGHKLAGALADLGGAITVSGKRCLDAGASTGGFTDVLLRGGARQVLAVDVGYGQLAWSVRSDQRVTVLDRTNVRTLTPDLLDGPVQLGVADLSFISLTLVLPALTRCIEAGGDLVPMVKPQFEVGRDRLGKGGVVRDPVLRAESVRTVCHSAAALGWGTAGVTRSHLPGPSGNVEFFVWLRRDALPATVTESEGSLSRRVVDMIDRVALEDLPAPGQHREGSAPGPEEGEQA